MTNRRIYSVFRTSSGFLGIVGTNTGLCKVILPMEDRKEVEFLIKKEFAENNLIENNTYFSQIQDCFQRYFSGEKVSFHERLDLDFATEFMKKVWQVTQSIGYGEVKTYKWIAEKIGNPMAGRGVGQALAKNPLPIIIPCHRVIKKNGSLGGFSAGIEWKKKLIELEVGLI